MSSRLLALPAATLLAVFASIAMLVRPSCAQTQLAPPSVLQAFDVSAATLQKLIVPDPLATGIATPFSVTLTFGGREKKFDLVPVDVRAPGYQLWLQTPTGLQPIPPGPCTTFRGSASTTAADCIAASVYGGSLRAVLRVGGDIWSVQPLSDGMPGVGNPRLHVVMRGSDSGRPGVRCGNTALTPAPPTTGYVDSIYECELALEADHALFLANNGNSLATQAEVLGVVNAVDLIYQNDLNVSFTVTQTIVDAIWDPYTSDVAATLLDQFRIYWNANYAGLPRDVAHLFTARQVGAASSGAVGIAYTGTACSLPDAYGLSQTRWSPNMSLRVALTAHELGHNFGADHCDLQGNCGIMCSDIGSCSGVTSSFGPSALAEMNVYLQSVGCLTLVPTVPVVTGATPALIPTIDPPLVALSGSGFLGATSVSVGGTPSPAVQVLSDSMLVFEPPQALSLGLHPASVASAAGASNATVLFYQAADPCRVHVAPQVSIGSSLTWQLGGLPNDSGYLTISFFSSTVPLFGFDVIDQAIVLWAGALDGDGIATFTVPSIPFLLPSYTFYSQMWDQQPTGTVRSVSKVKRTDAQ